MQLDAFAILVLVILGFMALFATAIAVWYWKVGRKLIQ